MFGLPPSTSLSRPLPKSAVYEKFGFKNAEREAFDRDISRMAIVAWVSPKTVPAIEVGAEVQDFYVIHLFLKLREFNTKHLLHLTKLIPQRMIFALEHDGETQLAAVIDSHILRSEWQPTEEVTISLDGLNLDTVWENIVTHIGNLQDIEGGNLSDKAQNQDKRDKLQKQITLLERQCRIEKQTRKKYELYQEIIRLKSKLKG